MGIRIEHPQELIDQIQYSCSERGPYLPPASYKLVTQTNNRGVYSFACVQVVLLFLQQQIAAK